MNDYPVVAELVAESRARQGLPPRVSDPTTIRRVVVLLAGVRERPARMDRPTADAADRGAA